MKLKIRHSYTVGRWLRSEILEIDCRGEGTKESPIIIEPSDNFPEDFYIWNSEYYILINNLNTISISFDRCENIIMENCVIDYLGIGGSSNIDIKNTSINKSLSLFTCFDNKILDCNINKMKLTNSQRNNVQNCTIKKIKRNSFQWNSFKRNEIEKIYSKHSMLFVLSEARTPFVFITSTVFFILMTILLVNMFHENFMFLMIGFFLLVLIDYLILKLFLIKKKKKFKSYI